MPFAAVYAYWTQVSLHDSYAASSQTPIACVLDSIKDQPVKLSAVADDRWKDARAEMLEQLRAYRIVDERVLRAMVRVRRHAYIPDHLRANCHPYGDHPCSIGYRQTISQPFIVAYMTQRMDLRQGETVLEIGTGSGYQAAILAEMGVEVFTMEKVPELADHARCTLKHEGYDDVHVITGDGYNGLPEHAPFDAIIVTCAPDQLPGTLVAQLKDDGRLILPLGSHVQNLVILTKKNGCLTQENDFAVRFVPMVSPSTRMCDC
jgi:protein-L-isoaspartate(D-aspartate) O-methyltransferase